MPDTPYQNQSGSPSEDLTGREIGDYHILRRLGRGGMAVVYLAEQQSLGRQVALKVLKPELSGDENYVRRFHHEAKAAASLVHANIVQIHEVGQREGIHFIAQEYVAGQNLRQVLSRKGPLDVGLTVNIMRQVGAALHKASQQGITHRDIKPENIMLAPTGEVKVADFGLARVTQSQTEMELTQVGVTMGTPLYMSPEQVEAKDVDPRSDLYSFGVTCYQMLAGRTPFEGETALAIAVQHLKTDPERLEDVRPDIPNALCRIIHTLLAKRPDKRFQSAADLLRELRSLQIEGLEEGWPSDLADWSVTELLAISESQFAATQQLDTLMKTQALRQTRKHRWGFVVGIFIASLVAGTAIGLATRPKSLLDVPDSALPKIPKQESAQAQYYFAIQTNTERAWRSVEQYFPPTSSPLNAYYGARAKKQLADFYLQNDRPDDAMKLYSQLAEDDGIDDEIRLLGYIGQANVYNRNSEDNKALQVLSAAANLIKKEEIPREKWRPLDDAMDSGFVRNEFNRMVRELQIGRQ